MRPERAFDTPAPRYVPADPRVASLSPLSYTTDPLDSDVCDEARGWVVHRWELDGGSEVDVGELLQNLGGAAFGDSCAPVDHEILDESTLVERVGLDRYGHPGVPPDVADLLALGQVRCDDLIAVDAYPDDRELRAAVR